MALIPFDGHKTPYDESDKITIVVPEDAEWRPDHARRLMQRLSFGKIICRIVADGDTKDIVWQIIDVNKDIQVERIAAAVKSVYPDVSIESEPFVPEAFRAPFHRFVVPFRQLDHFAKPIAYVEDLPAYDPFIPLINVLGYLEANERVIYSIYFSGNSQTMIKNGISQLKPHWKDQMAAMLVSGAGVGLAGLTKGSFGWGIVSAGNVPMQVQTMLVEKLQKGIHPTYILAQIDAQTHQRALAINDNILAVYREFDTYFQALVPFAGLRETQVLDAYLQVHVTNPIEAASTSAFARLRELYLHANNLEKRSVYARFLETLRCGFNPHELATLWHLPHKEHTARRLQFIPASNVLADEHLRENTEGVRLGINGFGAMAKPIFLPEESRLAHCVIVGETGIGKSNLMHQLIQHDIAQGRGVAVLDPENRLIPEILEMSIPESRKDDVVILDVGDRAYPPPINPFPSSDDVEEDFTYRLMDIFTSFEADFADKQMGEHFSNALEAISTIPGATLRDIQLMFEDADFRGQHVDAIEDDAAYDFWVRYHRLGENEQNKYSQPIMRRLRDYYRKSMYLIACHPRPILVDKLVAENKIVLVSLKNDHMPGKLLKMLGGILVSQFQFAASADQAKQPFFLYIDEADRFVNDSVPELYVRARKRNMHVTLATQFFKRLAPKTQDVVLESTGAFLVFKSGDQTAASISRRTRPHFTTEDIMQIDPFNIVTFIRYGNRTLPAFSVQTEKIGPLEDVELADADEVRQRSRERYTPMRRAEILASLRERYPRKESGFSQTQNEPTDGDSIDDEYGEYYDDEEDDEGDDWDD